MLDLETGPLPLNEEILKEVKSHMSGEYTHITNAGRFDDFGIFFVSNNTELAGGLDLTDEFRLAGEFGLPLWNQRLLGLTPDDYRVTLRRRPGRALQLMDLRSQKLAGSISPRDVRRISGGGIEVVGESGYLIDTRIFPDINWIDRRLANADQGRRPSHFDNSHYVKLLEPGMEGQSVLYLDLHFFDKTDGEVIYVPDGVVIDLQTRRLLRRSFEQPLSYERWGEPFAPGHKNIMNDHIHTFIPTRTETQTPTNTEKPTSTLY